MLQLAINLPERLISKQADRNTPNPNSFDNPKQSANSRAQSQRTRRHGCFTRSTRRAMKHTGRITLLAALIGTAAHAAPFMAIGDNAELFLTGAASVRFDDNIYLNTANEQDDLIWSITPGVDLVFGKGSATQGNIYYREEFQKYSDASNQDTSLSNVGVNSAYDGGNTKFKLGASYAQVAQNDNNIRADGFIVRREVANFHANSEFDVTAKSSLGIGVTHDKTNYKPASYADLGTWALPVDFYSEYTEKLDLSIGYRFRDNSVSGAGVDSQDSFLNIGARGEFTPKLSGQVRVGYNLREFDVGGDDSSIGFEGNLSYALSEKTTYRFNLSNDYSYSGTGIATKKLSLGLQASNKFSEQLSMDAGLTYMATDYPTRDESFAEGNIGFTYVYSATVNFNASYTYRNNDGGTGGSDFTNNVFNFGANIRY